MKTSVTVSGATGTSAAIPVNYLQVPFSVGFGVTIGASTLTYKVQHTFDNPFDSTITPTWFDHTSVTGKTADADGNYAYPVRAIRLNVTAWTSGSATMTVLQGVGS